MGYSHFLHTRCVHVRGLKRHAQINGHFSCILASIWTNFQSICSGSKQSQIVKCFSSSPVKIWPKPPKELNLLWKNSNFTAPYRYIPDPSKPDYNIVNSLSWQTWILYCECHLSVNLIITLPSLGKPDYYIFSPSKPDYYNSTVNALSWKTWLLRLDCKCHLLANLIITL